MNKSFPLTDPLLQDEVKEVLTNRHAVLVLRVPVPGLVVASQPHLGVLDPLVHEALHLPVQAERGDALEVDLGELPGALLPLRGPPEPLGARSRSGGTS